jgi:hypothetical protein
MSKWCLFNKIQKKIPLMWQHCIVHVVLYGVLNVAAIDLYLK